MWTRRSRPRSTFSRRDNDRRAERERFDTPFYQSVGIITAVLAAILGIPRLLVDLTSSARLEKRLEIVQRLADKAGPDDAKAAIARRGLS